MPHDLETQQDLHEEIKELNAVSHHGFMTVSAPAASGSKGEIKCLSKKY